MYLLKAGVIFMQQYFTDGCDGKQIYVTVMDDVKDPKAVIQIIHGMAEYAGRYENLAKYFNDHGYIVFMDDHRAHGRTETDKTRGYCPGNIMADTLADEIKFYEELKAKYKLPVFVLGHSYGSFVTQAFAQAGTDCKAIGLIGTGYMGAGLMKTGQALMWIAHALAGKALFKLGNKVSSAFFRYKGDTGPSQWVVKDMDSRNEFLSNPMCGVDMSNNFYYYMMKETGKLYGRKAKLKLSPRTAIAMFCGKEDPIGGKGKKVVKLNKFYESVGIKTEMHIYEQSRHEVHNDVEKEKAMKDMVDFFDRYVVYKQGTIDELLAEEK